MIQTGEAAGASGRRLEIEPLCSTVKRMGNEDNYSASGRAKLSCAVPWMTESYLMNQPLSSGKFPGRVSNV